MALSRLLVTLLVLALLVAGCASRTATTTTAPTSHAGLVPLDPHNSTQDAPKKAAARNGTAQDQVDIQEAGNLTNGVHKAWNWTVWGGFRTMSVTLESTGLQGSPAVELVNAAYTLSGGDPVEVKSEGNYGIYSGTPGCLVCYDGTTDGNPYGSWSLRFQSDPSAAGYRLAIHVEY